MKDLPTPASLGRQNKSLQDELERDLVLKTCLQTRWLAVIVPGFATLFGVVSGEDISETMTPAVIAIAALFGNVLLRDPRHHVILIMTVTVVAVSRHAIVNEGCSASILPHNFYCCLPCLCALLFRETRAVIVASIGVFSALLVVYSSDVVSGWECPSTPMESSSVYSIIEHRLVPAVGCIVVNCIVMVTVVDQSRRSVTTHAIAAQSAQQLSLLRKNLLSRITDELRTPLHGIVGSVELLLGSTTLSMEDRETAALIQRCLSSIVGTCDNVLLAANSSTNINKHLGAKRSIFSLSRCVDDVVEASAPSAEAKGLELRVDFVGDTECMLRGMENQLLQVLRNLINNAIKFTDHGHVTVRVKTRPSRMPNSFNFFFEVEDTGQGFDLHKSQILFEAFQQGEYDAVSRLHKGAGLGLTIVRDLIQIMGGSICVKSTVGKGSRFFFELVMRKANMAEPRSGVQSEEGGGIFILDTQTESRNSCLSVAETIAPSQIQVHSFDDPSKFSNHVSDMDVGNSGRWIAILECLRFDAEYQSMLKATRSAGWVIFVVCDQDIYSRAAGEKLCSAVFRRPISLAQFGDALYAALMGPVKCSDASLALDENDETNREDGVHSHVPGEIEIVPGFATPAPAPAQPKRVVPKSPSVLRTNNSISSPPNNSQLSSLGLPSGTRIVVVDDTPMNVKVLTKILSRVVKVPVVSLYSGQAAIDYAENADAAEGPIFFLIDWHMPTVCGLTATKAIRRLCETRSLTVYIAIITADIEGLYVEMKKRQATYFGTVSRGVLTKRGDDDVSTGALSSLSEIEMRNMVFGHDSTSQSGLFSMSDLLAVDLVAGKPVTIQSIRTILLYFNDDYLERK